MYRDIEVHMVLPGSNVSLGLIQGEFGGVTPISLIEYYAGGLYVHSGTSDIPTAGLISFSNFLGKSKASFSVIQGNLIRRYFTTNDANIQSNTSTMDSGFNNTSSEGGFIHATNFSLPVASNLCMEYTGWLTVGTSGSYTFGLRSDDGSDFAMWIGSAWSIVSFAYGTKGVEPAPPNPGNITLTAGVAYPIRIRFTQGGGALELNLEWKPLAATTWASIPFTVFSCNGITPITATTIRQGFPEPRIIPGNVLRLDGYASTTVSTSTWSTNVVGGPTANINGSPEYTNPWFTFNHASKFLQIPHVVNVTDFTNAQAYTVMAYVYIDSTQAINTSENIFIEKWEFNTGYPYSIKYTNGGIMALAYDGTNAPLVFAPLTGLIDKWVHVAVTFNHINTQMTMYFNGAQVAQLTSYTLNNCSNNHAVYVMRRFNNTSPLSAKLGHISIYNSSLSQQSIDQHYNAYKPYFQESSISGMVFNFTFGTSNVPTQDSTGKSITTSSTAPTMVNDATRGWVVSLNNSFLNVPTFDIPVSYTKMCWAYSTAGDTNARNLMSSGNDTGGVHYMYNTNAYLTGGHNSSGAVINSVSDPNVTPINVWIHWALTYDNTSKTMTLYRNGTNVVSRVDTALNWTGGTNFLRIGAYTTGSFYKGFLDNARVFNRALTASEVLTIYNAESSGGTWA
jgi:hypothetical protein